MKYQVLAEYPDRIHCLVTRDDNSTFGQYIYGAAKLILSEIDAIISERAEALLAQEGAVSAEKVAKIAEAQTLIKDKLERVVPPKVT